MRKIKEINMSEIFSVVRLKERILIIVSTLALALFVGAAAGAITYATTDRHDHGYDYNLVRGEDGGFTLEGFCDYEKCPEPEFRGAISSEYITEEVTKQPTCCTLGVKSYYFTWADNSETYVYTETIPLIPHSYKGNVVFSEDGSASVSAVCTNEGCSNKNLSVSGTTDIELIETIPATCSSKRVDRYRLLYNGESVEVVKETLENIDHTLNGVSISEYLLEDGVYKLGTPGMDLLYDAIVGCNGRADASFTCEVCKGKYTVKVGRPDHVLAYDETLNQLPTFEADGRATVVCVNDNCDYCLYVTLPMMVEGGNTIETGRDHLLEERYLKYSFSDTKYGFDVNVDITLDWFDHTVEYNEADTIYPTFEDEGVAYVKCTYEGCDKGGHIIIPKIVIGENAVIIREATEKTPRIFRYTYENAEYNFTVSFEGEMGEVLSHKYVYELRDTDIPFQPKLFGKCDQPECSAPEIWLTDVPVIRNDVPASCTNREYIEFVCVYEGKTYYYKMLEFGDYAHDYELVDSKTIYPTADSTGKAVLFCTKAGCAASQEITLPKVAINEADPGYRYDEATNIETIDYVYTFTKQGESYTIRFTYNREKPHVHTYDYHLEPSLTEIGKLDFVGICNFRDGMCNNEYRESAVDAQLIEDTGTCTEPGYAIWEYVYDGVSYTYRVEGDAVAGHRFVGFDLNSDTTRLPDFKTPGQIDLYCDICGEFGATVELPVMYIGVNSTIKAETSQQITYHYSVTITYNDREITVKTFIFGPNTHTLAISESDTVYPTHDTVGKVVLKCTDGGCPVFVEYELPKVVINENSDNYSYDPETNLESVEYTYGFVHDDIPHVVQFTYQRVKPHTHEYEYKLETSLTTGGAFDLVGHCTFRNCTEEVREENVAAILVEDTSTCTEPGARTWMFKKNGVEYTCVTLVETPVGHNPAEGVVIIKPDFTTVGSADIRCDVCGEIIGTVELPVMLEGEEGNCTLISDEGNQALYSYTVTVIFEEKEITVQAHIVVEK